MKTLIIQRLYSNGLLTSSKTALEAIRRTVGIQSQEQAHSAEVGIGLRGKISKEDLKALYQGHQVIQAWANRWTLHLFDYSDWELLINARQGENLPNSYYRKGVDRVDQVLTQVASKIKKEGRLDKKKIVQMTQAAYPDYQTEAPYFPYGIMHRLVHAGVAFIDAASPPTKRVFIYANHFQRKNAEAALETLIPRYLNGFGPASLEDFAKWAGIKKSSIHPVWDRLEADHFQADFPSGLEDLVRGQTILGARFDSIMTGYLDKTWLFPQDKISDLWTKNGFLLAPIIYDGEVVGHWNYRLVKKKADFTINTWTSFNSNQLETKLFQVSQFLGRELGDITYKKI